MQESHTYEKDRAAYGDPANDAGVSKKAHEPQSNAACDFDAQQEEIFAQEQNHLRDVFSQLKAIEKDTSAKLDDARTHAEQDMGLMRDELTLDFDEAAMTLETLADFQAAGDIIDAYSRTIAINEQRLRRAQLLLEKPYFAKVTLQFKRDKKPRDIYLGAAGMTNEKRRHFIIDWRSPIAETYYNQEMGPTTYEVDGKSIPVDLKLRRQFEITRDTLQSYFDTTVAIEDPLLLKSLSQRHTEKLRAITATIQREQNRVVRHADVPVLLVNGIAGSGKTSVLLQRIAYLFYRLRDSLVPDQVYLFTPSTVFGNYIDSVLPDMGESNPYITTWHDFVKSHELLDHGLGASTTITCLLQMEEQMSRFTFTPADFCDVKLGDTVLLKAKQVRSAVAKFQNVPCGPRLAALVNEDLAERLRTKMKTLARRDDLHDKLFNLDNNEQIEIFGQQISLNTEEEVLSAALKYLKHQFAAVFDRIEDACWLNIDHIGSRLLNKSDLTSVEWLYCKILLAGTGKRDARFVMIDEVQDYTAAQLMVLARYFPNAHFLLLGDQYQAIWDDTATFSDIRSVFMKTHKQVDECRLMTSYRSTPEITELFCSLIDTNERIQTSSVQRIGTKPQLKEFFDTHSYLEALRQIISESLKQEGLTAVITATQRRAKWLIKQLDDLKNEVVWLRTSMALPSQGVVVMELPLAKGLEFDHVIIPDAQADEYEEDRTSRNRLYTTISRATHQLTIFSQGPLTPLLKNSANGCVTK